MAGDLVGHLGLLDHRLGRRGGAVVPVMPRRPRGRALAPVVGHPNSARPNLHVSVSSDGLYCATIGQDKSVKIYDVVNFDMTLMIRLPFLPTACEFIYKKGEAQQKIAVSDNTVGGVQVEFN